MEFDNIEKEVIAIFLGESFEKLQDVFLEGSEDCLKKSAVVGRISSLYNIEVAHDDISGVKNSNTNASVIIVALPDGGKRVLAPGPNASLLPITIPMPSLFSS